MNEELPPGWVAAPMAAVGDVRLGRQRAPTNHGGPHMRPYLRVANVHEDRIDYSDVMQMNFDPREFETFRLRKNDILLNEGQSLAFVGRPAMFDGHRDDLCFTNTLVRFRASDAVEPRFALGLFRHYMRSGTFTAIAKITTNIAHLGSDRFAQLPFLLPPLNEQRRIVAKLDALLARSKKAREHLDRIPKLLDALKRSILAAAFRGDLTADWRAAHPDVEPASVLLDRIRADRRRRWEDELRAKGKDPKKAKYGEPAPVDESELPELPPTWCWASFDDLTSFITSGSRGWAEYYAPTGARFLRVGNMAPRGEWELQLDDVQHVVPPQDAEGARTRVAEGDVLVSITADVGRVGLIPPGFPEAYVNQHVALCRPVAPEMAGLLVRALLVPDGFQRFAMDAQYGATKTGLSLDLVRTAPIPLPPAAEREALLAAISAAFLRASATGALAARMSGSASLLDRSALASAFRGDLVPQDPDDEPASALLERIRAAQPAPATKKTRTPREVKAKTADATPSAGVAEALDLVVGVLVGGDKLSAERIRELTDLGKDDVKAVLKGLVDAGKVRVEGKARGTTYSWAA